MTGWPKQSDMQAFYGDIGLWYGLFYLAGWRIDGSDQEWAQNRLGELLVGAATWAYLAAVMTTGAR